MRHSVYFVVTWLTNSVTHDALGFQAIVLCTQESKVVHGVRAAARHGNNVIDLQQMC
jgi:hypothetical protein